MVQEQGNDETLKTTLDGTQLTEQPREDPTANKIVATVSAIVDARIAAAMDRLLRQLQITLTGVIPQLHALPSDINVQPHHVHASPNLYVAIQAPSHALIQPLPILQHLSQPSPHVQLSPHTLIPSNQILHLSNPVVPHHYPTEHYILPRNPIQMSSRPLVIFMLSPHLKLVNPWLSPNLMYRIFLRVLPNNWTCFDSKLLHLRQC